jgi:hypothetical protein
VLVVKLLLLLLLLLHLLMLVLQHFKRVIAYSSAKHVF